MRKPLSNALDIDIAGGLTKTVMRHAGVALLVKMGRRSGVTATAKKHLPREASARGMG